LNLIESKIVDNEKFSTPPILHVVIDRMPDFRFIEYKMPDNKSSFFVSLTLDDLVKYYYHNPKNQVGFGGSKFHLNMVDGSKKTIKGPWSSRPSQILKYCDLSIINITAHIVSFESVGISIAASLKFAFSAFNKAENKKGYGITYKETFKEWSWILSKV